jgi:predicted enzyme related to lactoylglutathione lyase
MPGMGSYYVLESGGKPRAGILAPPMPQAPHAWLPYVAVANADATSEKAKRLGATTLVPPTSVPGVGRFTIVADPQGAAIGILQGES